MISSIEATECYAHIITKARVPIPTKPRLNFRRSLGSVVFSLRRNVFVVSTQYRNKILLVLDLLNELATVCLLQPYMISIMGQFNRTLTILMLYGVTVTKRYLTNCSDFKIVRLASLLTTTTMLRLTNYLK